MEIILDIGKDINYSLLKIARVEDKPLDIIASEMLSLGLRIHTASMNKSDEDEDASMTESDKLRDILKLSIQNQELLSEVLSMVFVGDRSRLGAFDTDTAIKFSEKLAEKHIKGRELL